MSENDNPLPQIKVNEPEPSDDDPWKGDKLDREDCAKKLTAVIQGQIAPMTISVNGEWGSGKTFMLKRWQKQLKQDGYKAIYFNAWEDDFLADPLVAIVGQLYKELNRDTLKNVCEAVKNAAIPFLKRVGLSMLNKGVERITGVDVAGIVEEEVQTAKEAVFDDYVLMTKSREALKEALQALADKCYETSRQPLVFIVDELDRCRPTFAIEVLERIKHLFNVNHMVFVLGIDRVNLGKSVQAVYGDIDVENYLHRFFDFDFRLPDADPKKFITALWDRYNIGAHLLEFSKSDVPGRYKDDGPIFIQGIIALLIIHRFTLREIEQCIKLYALTIKQSKPSLYTYPNLIPVLIILKLRNASLYRKYINFECAPNDVLDFLVPSSDVHKCDYHVFLSALVYATFLDDEKQKNNVQSIQRAGNKGEPLSAESFVSKSLRSLSQQELEEVAKRIALFRRGFESGYGFEALDSINEKLNLFSFDRPR